MKNILITGGAGFIGSNFLPYFLEKYNDYEIINLDKLTYAGDKLNNKDCENFSNYTFICGDICDRGLVDSIFYDYKIDGVINFAAESHVDNSIQNPSSFIKTNIVGTFTLLDIAKKYWIDKNSNTKISRFYHISTDEVYGSLGENGYFNETSNYAPNSPYSASKASSNLIVRSYNKTYGLDTIISNCSNNYGPKQHIEKLIPKIIKNCLHEKNIPIYGNGKNIRDWIYVLDHCKAIDLIFHKGVSGDIYNIGSKIEKTNIEITQKICEIMDKNRPRKNGASYLSLIEFVKDRAGHDFRYATDNKKIKDKLSWSPEESFESGLNKTIDWYLENE